MTAKLLILLIRTYQVVLSPFVGGVCRFQPSCSAYAVEAVATHGAWRGSLLSARRLSSCHPLGRAGFDPVPIPELPTLEPRNPILEHQSSKLESLRN